MDQDWITDRRPTEADGDGDGEVVLRRFSDGRQDSTIGHIDALVDWRHIGKGVPWKHTSAWEPPAPAPTKPALAVGQVWRRRDGEVVTIAEIDKGKPHGNTHPFWAGGYSYTPDGFWSDATAPSSLDLTELISEPQQAKPTAPTPRKFVAISRTVHEFGHTIDAIDDDGVAWWMVLGVGEDPGIPWTQLTPLPDREVEADA